MPPYHTVPREICYSSLTGEPNNPDRSMPSPLFPRQGAWPRGCDWLYSRRADGTRDLGSSGHGEAPSFVDPLPSRPFLSRLLCRQPPLVCRSACRCSALLCSVLLCSDLIREALPKRTGDEPDELSNVKHLDWLFLTHGPRPSSSANTSPVSRESPQ